jgi:hypothetical protein
MSMLQACSADGSIRTLPHERRRITTAKLLGSEVEGLRCAAHRGCKDAGIHGPRRHGPARLTNPVVRGIRGARAQGEGMQPAARQLSPARLGCAALICLRRWRNFHRMLAVILSNYRRCCCHLFW